MQIFKKLRIALQGFIQPPKFESTPPQARRKLPLPQAPHPKVWYVTEVYKMKKSWKIGEKWIKNQFSIEIFACKY